MRRRRVWVAGVVAAVVVAGTVVAVQVTADPTSSPATRSASIERTPARSTRTPVVSPTKGLARDASAGGDQSINQIAGGAPAGVAPATVQRLHRLVVPDALVTLPGALSATAIHQLDRMAGVAAVAAVRSGTVLARTGQRTPVRLRVAAIESGSLRSFTPSVTARSAALWRTVAAGDAVVGFGPGASLRHRLGDTLTLSTPGGAVASTSARLGGLATLGLPSVQALVPTGDVEVLQLHTSQVLVAAPTLSLATLTGDIHRVLGRHVSVRITRPIPVDQSAISPDATARIPAAYLELYRRAAVTCPGLPWTVLAGIGTVETGNGTDVHRSTKGAEGPMQFLPSTWAMWGIDADGLGTANINDPVDAVYTAARYLCAAGAGRGGQSLDQAVFAYNHAWWYVREVLTLARAYA